MKTIVALFIMAATCCPGVCQTPNRPARLYAGHVTKEEIHAVEIQTWAALVNFETNFKLVRDPAVENYLNELLVELLATRPAFRNAFRYRIMLVNDRIGGAMSFPTGNIYLDIKYLCSAVYEDEIVSLQGHEVGHIQLRHTVRRLRLYDQQQLLLSKLKKRKAGRAAINHQRAINEVIFFSAARGFELEADVLSVRMVMAVGYYPAHAEALFEGENLAELKKYPRRMVRVGSMLREMYAWLDIYPEWAQIKPRPMPQFVRDKCKVWGY